MHMGERMETLHSAFDSIVGSFSVIRLLYTFVLLAVAIVLLSLAWATGREIASTWGSGKIYLAEFSYFVDGAKKPEYGEQIRNESIQFYRYIRGLIRSAQRSHDIFEQKNEERRDTVLAPELAFDKHGALPEIDLSIQGVNVKSLLSYFVKLVSPANPEVSATIFKTDNLRRAYVALPHQNTRDVDDDSDDIPSPYIIDTIDNDSETAFRLACFLIWSQSSEREGSYDEFCDWARLLRIKFALDAKDADAMNQAFLNPDVNFVTRMFQRAWNGKIQYKNLLSTLYGLEKYVGKRTIAIGPGNTATIGAVVDILRYRDITKQQDGPTADWLTKLPAFSDDAAVLDEAFFSGQFVADCEDGKAAQPNIVRIVFDYPNANNKNVPAVMTGLLLRDETVLTYLPRAFPVREHEGIPVGAKVQVITCGNVAKESTVTEVKGLAAKNDSFMLLTVPALNVTQPAPRFDFEVGQEAVDDVTFAGFIRHLHSTFTRPPATAIDNDERYLSSGTKVQTRRTIRKFGESLLFSSAFSAGMIGSPIFEKNGKIIGMVIGGIYVNSHLRLRLARGLLLSSLKDQLTITPVSPTQ
jgi:hypothetical protein